MDLLQTSLHSRHLDLKAKMAPFAGHDMPIQYTSVKDEVLAVRERAGLFDVGHMGEFIVTGKDAVAFVDYVCTNNFAKAEVSKAVYSPLCNQQGFVIDDLICYKISNEKVLICVNAANIKKDWDWLNSHKENFDVELEDQSSQYSLLALQGPESKKFLELLGLISSHDQIEYYSIKQCHWKDEELILARTGYTGEDGFEIFCNDKTSRLLWDQFLHHGVTPCGLASRDVLRLEVCFPLYGHEINDEVTPLDANLKWTVKFDKESFLGKEALEKTTPRFKLIKLVLDKGIPRDHYPVLNSKGETVGEVTSGTMSVVLNKGIALARIDSKAFDKNEEYSVQIRNRVYPAKRQTKPFYEGGHK